ncbi:response regulator transcription factor [Halanaerobaculum tunisiense]
MKDKKILIIDDDKNICRILKDYLLVEGFEVDVAYTGAEGLKKAKKQKVDLMILDIMLPGINGWEICKRLHENKAELPIIMLSAKTKETDRITGLELGADDYITKPFSSKEVVARVKAVLRRTVEGIERLTYPSLEINKDYRIVKSEGQEISLTPKEFDLLWTLASAPKQVFSREKLLTEVWGYNYFGEERTVDTHIKSLRKKIGTPVKNYIKTVWGVGYKFEVANDKK